MAESGRHEAKNGKGGEGGGASLEPDPTSALIDEACDALMRRAHRVGAQHIADVADGAYLSAAARGDPGSDPREAMVIVRQLDEMLLELESERLRGVPLEQSHSGVWVRPARRGRRGDRNIVVALESRRDATASSDPKGRC